MRISPNSYEPYIDLMAIENSTEIESSWTYKTRENMLHFIKCRVFLFFCFKKNDSEFGSRKKNNDGTYWSIHMIIYALANKQRD